MQNCVGYTRITMKGEKPQRMTTRQTKRKEKQQTQLDFVSDGGAKKKPKIQSSDNQNLVPTTPPPSLEPHQSTPKTPVSAQKRLGVSYSDEGTPILKYAFKKKIIDKAKKQGLVSPTTTKEQECQAKKTIGKVVVLDSFVQDTVPETLPDLTEREDNEVAGLMEPKQTQKQPQAHDRTPQRPKSTQKSKTPESGSRKER